MLGGWLAPKYLRLWMLRLGIGGPPMAERDIEAIPLFGYLSLQLCHLAIVTPSHYRRLMNLLLAGLTWLDHALFTWSDIIIFSSTLAKHLRDLETVLSRLIKASSY